MPKEVVEIHKPALINDIRAAIRSGHPVQLVAVCVCGFHAVLNSPEELQSLGHASHHSPFIREITETDVILARQIAQTMIKELEG